jgi:hypothetical protein
MGTHVIQLQPVCFTWGCGRPRKYRGYCYRCRNLLRIEEDVQPYDRSVFRERKKCSECRNRLATTRDGRCRRCHDRERAATPEFKKQRAGWDRKYQSKPEVKRKIWLKARARKLAQQGVTRQHILTQWNHQAQTPARFLVDAF